ERALEYARALLRRCEAAAIAVCVRAGLVPEDSIAAELGYQFAGGQLLEALQHDPRGRRIAPKAARILEDRCQIAALLDWGARDLSTQDILQLTERLVRGHARFQRLLPRAFLIAQRALKTWRREQARLPALPAAPRPSARRQRHHPVRKANG